MGLQKRNAKISKLNIKKAQALRGLRVLLVKKGHPISFFNRLSLITLLTMVT